MLLERKGRVASRCRFDSLSLHSDNTAHSDASEHWSSCCSRQLCCWFKGITNLSILTHVSTLNTGETEKTDDEFMVSLSCRVNWRSVHASWDPLLKRTKLPKKQYPVSQYSSSYFPCLSGNGLGWLDVLFPFKFAIIKPLFSLHDQKLWLQSYYYLCRLWEDFFQVFTISFGVPPKTTLIVY